MLSDAGVGLAKADRSIAEAERSMRMLEAMIPQVAARGYPTAEIKTQLEMLTEILGHLKTQRWEIEGQLGAP